MRGVGARDHEQARGVPIEAVNDSRPVLVTARSLEGEQPVDECAGLVPCAGMNHDTGGLVDDEQVLVLPGDAEVHLLGDERRRVGRQLDEDILPTCQPMALAAGLTVDEDGSLRDQAFGEAPRSDLGASRERSIETLGLRGAKAESCQAGLGGASSGGRRRPAPRTGSPPRRR